MNMSYIKKLLKDNKGLAMESVILLTVVVFALCAIVTMYSLKITNNWRKINNIINTRLYLDSIGDDYLNYINGNSDNFDKNAYFYYVNKKEHYYNVSISDDYDTDIKELVVKDGINTELTIIYEKDKNSNKYFVIRWVYGDYYE